MKKYICIIFTCTACSAFGNTLSNETDSLSIKPRSDSSVRALKNNKQRLMGLTQQIIEGTYFSPANEIAYGNGSGLTSSSNFTWNGSILKIVQATSSNQAGSGFLLTNQDDVNNGVLFKVGYNGGNNRQLWIGDNVNDGSSTAGFMRMAGGQMPYIDAVKADGSNRMYLNLGTTSHGITIGASTYNSSITSKVAVYGNQIIGENYVASTAPQNGLIVEGKTLIGSTTDLGDYKLQIGGTGYFSGGGDNFPIGFTSNLKLKGNYPAILLEGNGTEGWLLGRNGATDFSIGTTNGSSFNHLLNLSTSGRLTLQSPTTSEIKFKSTGVGGKEYWLFSTAAEGYGSGDGSFALYNATDNAYRFTVSAAGNFGINTHIPQYTLDVNGAMRIGSLAADPTGAAGVLYYNSALNKLKAYVNGAWKNVLMEGDVAGGNSNDFIQNQNAVAQAANFHINGSAKSKRLIVDAFGQEGSGGIYFRDGFTDVQGYPYNISITASHIPSSGRPIESAYGLALAAADGIKFITNTNTDNTGAMTLTGYGAGGAGNLLIGTTVNSGYKLDVNGTARILNTLTVGNNNGWQFAPLMVQVNSNYTYGFMMGEGNQPHFTIDNSGFAFSRIGYKTYSTILQDDWPVNNGFNITSSKPLFLMSDASSGYMGRRVIIGSVDNGVDRFQVDGTMRFWNNGNDPNSTNGGVFYNSSSHKFRGYQNGAWKNFLMEGDVTGGGGTGSFIENQNTAAQAGNFWINGSAKIKSTNTYQPALTIEDGSIELKRFANIEFQTPGSLTPDVLTLGAAQNGPSVSVSNYAGDIFMNANGYDIKKNGLSILSYPATGQNTRWTFAGGAVFQNGAISLGTPFGDTWVQIGGSSNPTAGYERKFLIVGDDNTAAHIPHAILSITNNAGTIAYLNVSQTGVVSASSLAGTSNRMVVADANGNLSTQAIPSGSGGGSVAIDNDADNRLTTALGNGQFNAESNLTFDGNNFLVGGNIRVNTSGINLSTISEYRLAVNGNALFTRVKVKESNAWPDYVFDDAYKLPTLKEVEAFIKQHKHLPEVPSAQQVKKDGLDVGDNQALLLRKIEELTLYAIEQNKKQEEQNKRIEQLEKELEALKKK